jgi:hypothetical protein
MMILIVSLTLSLSIDFVRGHQKEPTTRPGKPTDRIRILDGTATDS